jgi:uncharacterized membrane protein
VAVIKGKADSITLKIDGKYAGSTLSDIQIINKFKFNWFVVGFWFVLAFLVCTFIVYRESLVGHTERIFLLMAVSIGFLIVLMLPISKVGLDEEAHFWSTYKIKFGSTVSSTTAIDQLCGVSLSNWPYNLNQSSDEYELMVEYYDVQGDYTFGSPVSYPSATKLSKFATLTYTFIAVGIKLAKLLRLPFSIVYIVGRLFNLIMYIGVVYFAVKKLPYGKNILAVLALMPTTFFQACVYSYDSVVNAFTFLGLAYLIYELAHPEEKITVKNGVIILASFSIACLPKAVYFPMIALGFMIKNDKFKNKKERNIFRIANVVCIIGIIATIIIPMYVGSSAGSVGDTRGGDVNMGSQKDLIFSQPFAYAGVMISNVFRTFWDYTFGNSAHGIIGHLDASPCVTVIGLLLIYVIATDVSNGEYTGLTVVQKVWISVAGLMCMALVWTSMYMAFNEIGVTQINGVQGRYFIPLLPILYFVLHSEKMENKLNKVCWNVIVYGLTTYIWMYTIYKCILVPLCL